MFTYRDCMETIESITGKKLSSMVAHQIEKFRGQGITYIQIARAVTYFYAIKHNDVKKIDVYGIGIVPSILQDSESYWRRATYAKKKQEEEAKKIHTVIDKLYVKPYRKDIKRQRIDIDEIK